jgi:hypothetical protein
MAYYTHSCVVVDVLRKNYVGGLKFQLPYNLHAVLSRVYLGRHHLPPVVMREFARRLV